MKIELPKIYSRCIDRLLAQSIFVSMALCSSITILILIAIFGKGIGHLSWNFLATQSLGNGTEGGILYQLLGTLIIVSAAALIAGPCAMGLALTAGYFAKSTRIRQMILNLLHIINTTPSVLLGLLGYVFLVRYFAWGKTWLAGSVVLAIMILPATAVAIIERIRTMPTGYLLTGKSLGLSENRIATSIVLPYSIGGLWTGLMMGLARAAGETAPIMFTAAVFSGATFPTGFVDSPVVTLSYHIYNLAQDTLGDQTMPATWSTALVLVALACSLNLAVLPLRNRHQDKEYAQ